MGSVPPVSGACRSGVRSQRWPGDCLHVRGHESVLSKPSLSQKTAPCLGRTFPALVIFPLFYPNCTCANKTLTGGKPRSRRERRAVCGQGCVLPAPLAPGTAAFPSPAAAGMPVGISPAQGSVCGGCSTRREDQLKRCLLAWAAYSPWLMPGLLPVLMEEAGSCLPSSGLVQSHRQARAGSRVSGYGVCNKWELFLPGYAILRDGWLVPAWWGGLWLGALVEQRCCWCWSSCAGAWAGTPVTSVILHPWLGAPVCPQLRPWQSRAVPAGAEAPGLLRAHARPGGCDLPKGFSRITTGREGGMRGRGIRILLVIISQLWCGGCGGDCEPPAGFTPVRGGSSRRDESSPRVFLY